MRRLYDCLPTFVRTSLSLIHSQCSREVSHSYFTKGFTDLPQGVQLYLEGVLKQYFWGNLIVFNTTDTRHTVMPWRNPFPPELFHIGIVCLLLLPIPSPQRSLGHSLFKQKFSQKCLCFLCCFVFCVAFVFYFIKISKFALPGVLLKYERNQ